MKYEKKTQRKELSLARIAQLFNEAALAKSQERANRYVVLARRIGMAANQPLPRIYKRKFCKHCYTYFREGNYRVRNRTGKVIYCCLTCKKYMRFVIQNGSKK